MHTSESGSFPEPSLNSRWGEKRWRLQVTVLGFFLGKHGPLTPRDAWPLRDGLADHRQQAFCVSAGCTIFYTALARNNSHATPPLKRIIPRTEPCTRHSQFQNIFVASERRASTPPPSQSPAQTATHLLSLEFRGLDVSHTRNHTEMVTLCDLLWPPFALSTGLSIPRVVAQTRASVLSRAKERSAV